MTDSVHARALARLKDASSPLTRDLVALAVDAFLDRPVSAWVDADQLSSILAGAITEATVARVLEAHVRPAIGRHQARARSASETVADLLPDGSAARIEVLLDGARRIDAPWARGIVETEALRDLIAPVVQETLIGFAKKLPIPGIGGGEDIGGNSRLAGMVRRGLGEGASRIAEAGRSVGKSVIGGFDKKLHGLAHDFSRSAVREMREALEARLKSDEGRAILKKLRTHAVAKILALESAELLGILDALPPVELDALVRDTLVHNVGRELIANAIREEVDSVLAIEGEKSVRTQLEQAGLHDRVRAMLVDRGVFLLNELTREPGFEELLEQLLAGGD